MRGSFVLSCGVTLGLTVSAELICPFRLEFGELTEDEFTDGEFTDDEFTDDGFTDEGFWEPKMLPPIAAVVSSRLPAL